MIDHPQLVEVGRAHDDLIEVGVIRHAVGVKEVAGWILGHAGGADPVAVDVDPLGMVRRIAVIGEVRIDILDQMIPCVPFPDDSRVIEPHRFEFDEHVGPKAAFGDQLFAPSGSAALFNGLELPGDGQQVAIGKHGHIVVRKVRLVIGREVPDELAIEAEPLESARLTAAGETERLGLGAAPDHASVIQHVDPGTGDEVTLPGPHCLPIVVDQVGGVGSQWCKEHVARTGAIGVDADAAGFVQTSGSAVRRLSAGRPDQAGQGYREDHRKGTSSDTGHRHGKSLRSGSNDAFTALLLRLFDCGPAGQENPSSIRKRHVPAVGSVRSVQRLKTVDENLCADRQSVLRNSPPEERVGCAAFDHPPRYGAVLLGHIDVEP